MRESQVTTPCVDTWVQCC